MGQSWGLLNEQAKSEHEILIAYLGIKDVDNKKLS